MGPSWKPCPELSIFEQLNKVKKHTANTPIVRGYDWNQGIDYSKLFESYVNTEFQATNLWMAIREINRMVM
ncbi:probable deoxyhypusine synthase [Bactrocera dorsalis]|uniref:Probable deoxyhypusine synthase n=1 Tax=Bactrocera dorsalis TaxID=27457 RepID=A0ABM3K691_BACDO|nr:probable deoxyhypusine synthase [Bactrocera dorsalis]